MRLRFAAIGIHIHGPGSIQEILAAGDTELVGIAESDPARRDEVSQQYSVPIYADHVEMLDALRPDLATVCNAHHEKAEAILSCLERNVHVLVDKPMVIELEDLARVEEALKSSTSELQMMVTERFAPPFVRLKELVESGFLGEIAGCVATRPHEFALADREPWMVEESKEGGPILDLMIHDIDLMRWYSGASVQSVTAHHAQRRWKEYPGFNDVAHAMFAMDSGIIASMEADWLTPRTTPWDCRFFLTGTEGAAEVRSLHFSDLLYWRHEEPRVHVQFGRNRPDSSGQDLVRRIRGQSPVIATAQDAIDSTRAVLMAREAARKGQTLSL